MAFDLNLVNTPTFNNSGKYGKSFASGRGQTNNVFVGLTSYTLEAWVKTSSTGSIIVATGSGGCAWLGMVADGRSRASYGNGDSHDLHGPVINDGAWHHLRLTVSNTAGGVLYVDGISAATSGPGDATIAAEFGVRFFGGVGFDWIGEVDEVALTSGVTNTSNFTPGPVLNNRANLVAVWHLEGDGINSAGLAEQAPSGDTTPPTAVTDIVFSNITSTGYTATWPAASDNVGVVGYKFDDGSGVFVDAGNVLSKVVTGKSPSTAYTARVRGYDAAGNEGAVYSEQVTTAAGAGSENNALDTAKMIFSPGNWNLASNSARAINAGAYFSTLFTGSSCKLQFDMSGVTSPSVCYYQVDNGPMTEITVAANIVLNVPAATAQWADKGGRILRFIIKQRNPGAAVWFNSAVMVALTGIVLEAGKTLLLPANKRKLSGLVMGDSITEGQVTLDSTGNGDATLSYAYALRDLLGAEIGVIGFGGQGWTVTGGGGSPVFTTTYNKIYDGVARSFAGLDFILINHATNDGGNDVTAAATSVLNGLLADPTLPAGCKIIVMRPFNGAHAAQLQAAIAASTNPARISYMDTTNFFNTANAYDGLHPWGNESSTHIAPQVATSTRAVLAGAPPLTQRTATISFNRGPSTAPVVAANLSGAKVAFYDEPTPDLYGVARYQTAAETMDANGVMTATYGSALPAGGTAGYVVQFADGQHYNGQVVLS